MTTHQQAAPGEVGLNAQALANLDAAIQADIDNGRNFGASIIVARDGVIGHRKTFGTVAPNRPVADDDLFLMMSLSKSFTAALVLHAIDQGRFTLDTRIDDLLPGFGANGKQSVTVRMLLTHTGGTYTGFAPPAPATLADLGNLAKCVAAYATLPVAFKPGTESHYNPFAGLNILAQILVLTDPAKRAFRTIAKEDLFEPLGMKDAAYGIPADHPRRVKVSVTDMFRGPGFEPMVKILDTISLGDAENPSGGAHATIDDVFCFTEAMRRHGSANDYRLMSPALFDYAARNHTGDMINVTTLSAVEAEGRPPYRANFSLLGGYARDEGHFQTPMGFTASPRTICAMGGASTFWMVDPERDLTFIFLSAGFIEGLAHADRLSRLSDLALSACEG